MSLKRFAPIAISFLAAFTVSCATTKAVGHDWWHGTLTLHNDSSYAVHHLYLTPAHAVRWGPDQLGHDVLEHAETITLAGLDCEEYDLKLIDHEGDECVVEDIDLCLQDASWSLTDRALAACTGFRK